MKTKVLLIALLVVHQLIFAQKSPLWENLDSRSKVATGKWSQINVSKKRLNPLLLKKIIDEASQKGAADITLPHPDGRLISCTIQPTCIMAPELQAKFPEIKTFKGVNSKGEVIRVDVGYKGFHAIVLAKEGTFCVEPESNGHDNHYVSYFGREHEKEHLKNGFIEEHIELDHTTHDNTSLLKSHNGFRQWSVGAHLKKYRIAIAAQNDYVRHHGGTVEKALSAIVTSLNRITGVFEKDMAITFELVADNDKLIFASPSSDPYPSDKGGGWYLKNQEVTDQIIGFDNYDVGHLFSGDGGGGLATLERVCRKYKAQGVSNMMVPEGYTFDITIVAHEIGHQFGARHTFAHDCAGGFQSSDAFDIGGGSTIMSYNNLCGYNAVAFNADDYFHCRSHYRILGYLTDVVGSCGTEVNTGNTPPQVSAPQGGFVIPVKTPFVLEAESGDKDGDELTYTWEEYDLATQSESVPGTPYSSGGTGYSTSEEFIAGPEYVDTDSINALIDAGAPQAIIDFILRSQERYINNFFTGDGPLFRTFPPSGNKERYFPRLEKVVAGETPRFEILPYKTRALNFVVTARDNKGGMSNSLVTFSSTEDAGPFIVTSNFKEPQYNGFSNLLVEWDVANTDKAPVNCTKVNILFSSDGGENFDFVLLENTANDGSEPVKLPNIATTKGRIMVKAVDNIFFNVNSTDFTVSRSEVDIPKSSTDLSGKRVNDSHIELSWTDNSSLEDGFIIERKTGDDNEYKEIARTVMDVSAYNDNSVNPYTSYSYRVASYNATGVSAYTNTISFGAATNHIGLNDAINNAIYPNPAQDKLFLSASLAQLSKHITIYDLRGRKLLDIPVTTPVEQVDVSGFDNGLYVIKISTRTSKIVTKFYKQ